MALHSKSGPGAAASRPDGDIIQLKIWLKGVSPMIWRRVQVPATTTLRELHGVFQVAMGWEGIHLYEFTFRAIHYGPLNSVGDRQMLPLAICSSAKARASRMNMTSTFHGIMRSGWRTGSNL
jgi:hypothetical protein